MKKPHNRSNKRAEASEQPNAFEPEVILQVKEKEHVRTEGLKLSRQRSDKQPVTVTIEPVIPQGKKSHTQPAPKKNEVFSIQKPAPKKNEVFSIQKRHKMTQTTTDEDLLQKNKVRPSQVLTPKVWLPTSEKQLEADCVWTHWLTLMGIPFSVSNMEPTRAMMAYFNNNMVLKSDVTYGGPKVQVVARILTDTIREEIDTGCQISTMFGVSVEILKRKCGACFLAADLYFVNGDFKFKHVVLGVREVPDYDDYDSVRTTFDLLMMTYPTLTEGKIMVTLDKSDKILERALTTSALVANTTECTVKKLEDSVKRALERQPETKEIMMLCLAINDVLNNQKSIRTKMEEYCKVFEGMYLVLHLSCSYCFHNSQGLKLHFHD